MCGHTYLQKMLSCNYFSVHFRSVLDHFSFPFRSVLVRLSFVIRLPIKNQSKNERENNEKTAK